MPIRKRERRYTAQLVLLEEPEVAGRLRAWADVRDAELAPLLRQVVRAGLASLEPDWEREAGGKLTAEFLATHIADAPKLARDRSA